MSRRGKFWLAFTVLIMALLLGLSYFLLAVHIAFLSFVVPGPQTSGSTPPVSLGLLALIIAISLYLRQLATTADEKYDKIRSGQVPMYPLDKEYTKKKLAALNSTQENMHVAAPFMISLSVLAAVKFSVDAIASIGFKWQQEYALAFKVVDFVVLEWFVLAMVGLAILHWVARKRDEAIRDEAISDQKSAKRASQSS